MPRPEGQEEGGGQPFTEAARQVMVVGSQVDKATASHSYVASPAFTPHPAHHGPSRLIPRPFTGSVGSPLRVSFVRALSSRTSRGRGDGSEQSWCGSRAHLRLQARPWMTTAPASLQLLAEFAGQWMPALAQQPHIDGADQQEGPAIQKPWQPCSGQELSTSSQHLPRLSSSRRRFTAQCCDPNQVPNQNSR